MTESFIFDQISATLTVFGIFSGIFSCQIRVMAAFDLSYCDWGTFGALSDLTTGYRELCDPDVTPAIHSRLSK